MSQKANNLIDRLKSELSIKKDKDLCLLLGIKHNTLSTWKKRDTLDFNKILELCEKHDLDLNYIFFEEEEERQQSKADEAPLLKEANTAKKTKLRHFLSTKLISANRNITIFYNQVNEGEGNISGEIIVCQKISIKKIVANNLYVIEDKANTLYIDELLIIKDINVKTPMVYLEEAKQNIELKSIVNVWRILDRSTNIMKFIKGLPPL